MVAALRLWLRLYDLLTGWLYCIFTNPAARWETLKQSFHTCGCRRKEFSAVRATSLRPVRPGDTSVTYKPTPIQGNSLVRDFEHAQLETMAEVWWWVVGRYGDRRLLGTRDVLGEQEEIQPNGTVFMKLDLGDYRLVRLLNFP